MLLGLLFEQKYNVRESHSPTNGLLVVQGLPGGQISSNFLFQGVSERLQAFLMSCDTAFGHMKPGNQLRIILWNDGFWPAPADCTRRQTVTSRLGRG
jgi:hypothetical protein